MPREKEGFREQLARLDEKFPAVETIKLADAISFLGICRETLLSDTTFPARKMGNKHGTGGVYIVPKVALARWLA